MGSAPHPFNPRIVSAKIAAIHQFIISLLITDSIESIDIAEEVDENAETDLATRKGRFRISNAPGPPETSHGRFRISPHGMRIKEKSYVNEKIAVNTRYYWIAATYGPPSPCLQRGRFAVIPEEPLTSTSNNTEKRSPSPDWDFNTEVSP